ncbi:MAG TPA: hypothetical protein VF608_09375 [Thermoanaerobaculia bacterium]
MTYRVLVALLLLSLSTVAFGQVDPAVDPLRNLAGTAQNPGEDTPWVRSTNGQWTFFHGFDAHITYVSETGPEEQRNEIFSTNWFGLGAQLSFDRGFVLARGRVSLEPYTVPEEGYPQILQYVSTENGGELLVDFMRPHDLIGEAAIHAGWRPTPSTLVHVYGALVGDPALGPPPFALRSSSIDLAEAPFSYDIAETFHDSTNVVTAGFATRFISLEASTFHDAVTTGDHTELDDDSDMDSMSYRVTLMPSRNLSIQASRGELGEDLAQRNVTSASVSYGGPMVAATALWTRREYAELDLDAETAYGFELAIRGPRHTVMGRAEWVDRPFGFPVQPFGVGSERTTHYAVGYLFDFLQTARLRGGAGVTIDYHTQSRELEEIYGHKPQSIYAFVRFRTGN